MSALESELRQRAEQVISECSYFDNQDASFCMGLAEKMQMQIVKDGEVLHHQGQPVTKLMILEKGCLQRFKINRDLPPDSQQTLIDTIEEGSAVCMLHLFTIAGKGDPSYATIKSVGESVVWTCPCEVLQTFVTSNPTYSLHFIGNLVGELRANSKLIRAMKANEPKVERKSSLQGTLERRGSVFTRQSSQMMLQASRGLKVMCYDSTTWARVNFAKQLEDYNKSAPEDEKIFMSFTTDRCSPEAAKTAVGNDAVCCFVNDNLSHDTLVRLSLGGVKMVAMRCAGFDRVDQKTAEGLGLTVARVPAYSPFAVAEHAVTLFMALNRKICAAHTRVNEGNFTLDGLVGMDIHAKRVAVVGTGRIGVCLCNILLGFGAELICFDVYQNEELKKKGATYVDMDTIWSTSDVIFLMTPLLPSTKHMFNESVIPKLKQGVFIINTSRGGLIDTEALIKALREGVVRGVGLDVYEHEEGYFFEDRSSDVTIQDRTLADLMSFKNVLLTAHQAFFTQEAISSIVKTTIENLSQFIKGKTGRAHPNSIFQ